ncbi:HAD-IIB family hydrolase [Martelella endophytica]|uniref:Mannosyl-3-phosphoglycerate phosphatase n=1 Tax=Martelella endophytica TaxID=1486262 RepID=A0A0D5LVT8_MAREN|nr:HAD-IIB family hydrolase [Martelella endophytica]AJY48359.1 mannosyl-3-phosphoglycerate phosphatase [Martelella endophytica]
MHIVFTDLDGTLLDHETYSLEPARPALAALKQRGIPLILASSKTEAEMRPIAADIGIDDPMIVENGAGVVNLPDGAAGEDGVYARLRAVLDDMPRDLRQNFAGFGDWSDEEVAQKTGMPLETARLARMRRFSEPGLWNGSEDERDAFRGILDQHGFQAVQGGRFFTLMPKTSKADAMRKVAALYREMSDEPLVTVALGDAPNDAAMLEAADIGIIIANPAHAALPETARERAGFIRRSEKPGPAGWNDMILQLLV